MIRVLKLKCVVIAVVMALIIFSLIVVLDLRKAYKSGRYLFMPDLEIDRFEDLMAVVVGANSNYSYENVIKQTEAHSSNPTLASLFNWELK